MPPVLPRGRRHCSWVFKKARVDVGRLVSRRAEHPMAGWRAAIDLKQPWCATLIRLSCGQGVGDDLVAKAAEVVRFKEVSMTVAVGQVKIRCTANGIRRRGAGWPIGTGGLLTAAHVITH